MRAINRRNARGFSRVEFVAVLGVIVLLAPTLTAALQQSRENARLAQCKNNLKQIGLALHNYHDTYNCFAPGWVGRFAQADSPPAYGWQASILPFVEQAPLFNQIKFDRAPLEPTPILQAAIPVYRCPSDTTEIVNPLRSKFGTSNYSGNFGHVAPQRWAPGPLAEFWPGGTDTPSDATGIFYWNSKIRIRDIKDGTTNTFMVGERCVTSAAGIWAGVTSNKNETDATSDCSVGNEINSGIRAFSSLHAGGAQFAMCDGSVRFISEKISTSDVEANLGLFQKLGGRNDHLIISEEF